jgi:hypothetical protein
VIPGPFTQGPLHAAHLRLGQTGFAASPSGPLEGLRDDGGWLLASLLGANRSWPRWPDRSRPVDKVCVPPWPRLVWGRG